GEGGRGKRHAGRQETSHFLRELLYESAEKPGRDSGMEDGTRQGEEDLHARALPARTGPLGEELRRPSPRSERDLEEPDRARGVVRGEASPARAVREVGGALPE